MSIVGKWLGFAQDEIYEEGTRAFEHGDFEGAIAAFSACLDEPGSEPAMTRLAKHYLCEAYAAAGLRALRQEDFAAAKDYLEKAIEISPNYPDLHLALARAHRGFGDRKGVEAALDRALQLHGRYVAALLMRAERHYEDGDPDQGLELVEQAALADSRIYGDAYRNLKGAHQQGDFPAALSALRKLSPEHGQSAVTHCELADSYMRASRYEEAIREFETAVQSAPGYADVRCKYGKALLEAGRPEDAVEQFRQAVQINERYVEAHAHLGVALARLGREMEAGNSFQQALVLDPHHPVAIAEAGKLPARRSLR